MKRYLSAFTLAEVLIVISIIGIVAAITLLGLIANINEKQYENGRQKALSIIGEAGKRIIANDEMNSSNSAQNFINNVLSKYIKIIKICTPNKLQNCGWSTNIKTMNGNDVELSSLTAQDKQALHGWCNNWPNLQFSKNCSNSAYSRGFVANNGYSFIIFYNPSCEDISLKSDVEGFYSNVGNTVCLHVLYDMNGKRGPNKFGSDIGTVSIISLGENIITVAPKAYNTSFDASNYTQAQNLCNELGNDYHVPSQYELLSILYSGKLASIGTDGLFSSNFSKTRHRNFCVAPYTSFRSTSCATKVRCVKK